MGEVLATNHVTQIVRISRKRGVGKEGVQSDVCAAFLDGVALAKKRHTKHPETSKEGVLFRSSAFDAAARPACRLVILALRVCQSLVPVPNGLIMSSPYGARIG